VGIRCADHATPSTRKRLALTSPTSGGRSVGIVRLRTKATEFIQKGLFRCAYETCVLERIYTRHIEKIFVRPSTEYEQNKRGRDSSVSVAQSCYGQDGRVRFPAGARDVCLPHSVQTYSGAYSIGTGGSFPASKAAGG
jgi:hypothetical protein